mmetsp:Transcript_55617/g.134827  ORF Transcript_55617/g.134827 Transcript_55617/m.134827 type:complete len:130 (+) Transcript_55617:152-541(+)
MTERSYGCMCGNFKATLTGEPALACWCHCGMCRKQTGAAMQLGVWSPDNLKITSGESDLIKYSSTEGKVFRNSCTKCGSFCYKILPDGNLVAPLGALDPVVKPTCHIFVADKGNQDVMFPDLPQHDAFP